MNKGEQSVTNHPPIEVWQTESLRLTVFTNPTDQIGEQTWWNNLTGESPETKLMRPRTGGQQEEGRFEEGKLVLVIQPDRIDWRFTVADRDSGVEELPTVGPFPESLDRFVKLMIRWFKLETCPSAQRLAFGAVLLQPVKTRQEGYQQVSLYLPYNLDPEGSSDFMYQINRPRNSTSKAGLKINRLSKWSVATTWWMKSQIFLGLASATHSPGPQIFACRLELDINTVPDLEGEIAREQLPEVFGELVMLGKEVAREGDIP